MGLRTMWDEVGSMKSDDGKSDRQAPEGDRDGKE